MPPLPTNPRRAPLRKFRGKRRYFRRLHDEATAFRLDVTPESWWNHWHRHVDRRGWGNLAWRYRREHLRALAAIFRTVLAAAPTPFQAWIYLNERDAGEDAVFLHSPNPHTPFPFKHDAEHESPCASGYDDDIAETLRALLPGLRLRFYRCTFERDDLEGGQSTVTYRLVYSPDAGIPIE